MVMTPATDVPTSRVLVIADWKVDPQAVVRAVSRQLDPGQTSLALLVPAWLHGIDWAGDPFASIPCAERALAELTAGFQTAGLAVRTAKVGDPDPVAAVVDLLLDEPADMLLVCDRAGRLRSHPLDLAHRTRRATGLPLVRLALPQPRGDRAPRARTWLGAGHCRYGEAAAA
jgi:hypothetical protein